MTLDDLEGPFYVQMYIWGDADCAEEVNSSRLEGKMHQKNIDNSLYKRTSGQLVYDKFSQICKID